MIDDPSQVTEGQMEAWVHDLDSWDLCDQLAGNLFDRTRFAFDKAVEWSAYLHTRAIATAREIQGIDSRSARWIAGDALRELESAAVRERVGQPTSV